MRQLSSVSIGPGAGFGAPGVCNGRLTLASGVPVMTSDQLAKTTLYFTPYEGDMIGLYDGTDWAIARFAEVSVSLSGLTAGTNHDVFAYLDDGDLTLDLVAWTSDSARATALALQDGIEVKSGAAGHRYLGTIRTTAAGGQCEFSFGGDAVGGQAANLFVWNRYNRRPWAALVRDTTESWTYGPTTTWRPANNSAGNRVNFVIGVAGDPVRGAYHGTGGEFASTAVLYDSTTAPAGVWHTSSWPQAAHAAPTPGAGFHFLAAGELGVGGTKTFTGIEDIYTASGLIVEGWA